MGILPLAMGLFSNLFGRKAAPSPPSPSSPAAPRPNEEDAPKETVSLSLQLLLEAWTLRDEAALLAALRGYDASLSSLSLDTWVCADDGTTLCDIQWQGQRFRLVAFNHQMPADAVEACVQPCAWDQEFKRQARAHEAHVLLLCDSPRAAVLQNYVRLAMLCGGLLEHSHGIGVLNETAQTAMPAKVWLDTRTGRFEQWNTLPVLLLYAGFVKYVVPDSPKVWMTTRGLEAWGLPNLTTLAPDHSHGSQMLEIFGNVATYLIANGPVLQPGHTMQVGVDNHMKLRAPESADELAIQGEGKLLVAQFISAAQANKAVFPSKGLSN